MDTAVLSVLSLLGLGVVVAAVVVVYMIQSLRRRRGESAGTLCPECGGDLRGYEDSFTCPHCYATLGGDDADEPAEPDDEDDQDDHDSEWGG